MKKLAMVMGFVILGFMFCGCCKKTTDPIQGNKPPVATAPAQPQNPVDALRSRKPPTTIADCDTTETENNSCIMICSESNKFVENIKRNLWVAVWEKTAFISGLCGIGAGLIAGFLIIWFVKNFKLGLSIGGALMILGSLGFVFSEIVAHWQAIMWTMLIFITVLAAGYIWLLVEGKLKSFETLLKAYASKVPVDAIKDDIANTKIHSMDSAKQLLNKIGVDVKTS